MSILDSFITMCLKERVISSISIKTNIMGLSTRARKKEKEIIILVRALSLQGNGIRIKKWKDNSSYLTAISSKELLEIISGIMASINTRTETYMKDIGRMM